VQPGHVPLLQEGHLLRMWHARHPGPQPLPGGATLRVPVSSVGVPAEATPAIVNRLKRAQGQIGAVVRMLEEGRDCRDVLPQLAAVNKALDRAGFAMVASSLRECTTHPESHDKADLAELEKLFLSLA
jgi:DNA-binding FrmR family transcriptional regulator